jgi:EF hand
LHKRVYHPALNSFKPEKSMRHLALLLAAAAALSAASAQTIVPPLDEAGHRGELARQMKARSAAQFDATDVNKDGKLSKEEVSKASDYFASNFEKRDTDKDGFLSWEEFVGHKRWPK